MTRDEFVARYGNIYEHSAWVAERAWDGGVSPGADLAVVFRRVVERAGEAAHLSLLRAHPDLAGRLGTALTAESTAEQAGAGLDRCTPQEFEEFKALNDKYTARFGFPFIIAVKGLDRAAILNAFRQRVDGAPPHEFRTALGEVHKIAGFRLGALGARREVERRPVSDGALHELARNALMRAGADADNAGPIADNLLLAERDGSESHGVFRLPGYVAGLRAGTLNGTARPKILPSPPGAVVADGDGGAAPVAYRSFLPVLAEKAAAQGVAALALKNAVHYAAMWPEVEWLAKRGFAALACTASFPYVAPHGGRRARFGTNPIAFAYPRGDGVMAFDLATASMARGDVMLAARDGHPLPDGVGIDPDGVPSISPDAILEGAQLPFGGHKGSALALMVELLAAGTVGEVFSDETTERSDGVSLPLGGVFVLAISPEQLGGPDALQRSAAFLDRLEGEDGVRLPGARRHKNRANTGPLMVEAHLLDRINELAGGA
ncbi:MAG: 2-oxo-4-hydroxy-4-carboxy-5-ureidoimidazoline decarboxylase [Pseudomonadota bacterium]